MVSYFRTYRASSQAIRRDAVIQKIINAVFLVEATPVANRAKAVSAMDDPDLLTSLSNKPRWPLRFHQISYWDISNTLHNHIGSFSVSIDMGAGKWLNLDAAIYSHMLVEQFILLGIEVLVLGSLLVVVWSINRFTQPLRRFKKAAEKLGIDLHSEPLDIINGPVVVREAAQAMNQMQGRIQDLIRDRTQMLAAISHDLRTPITRMKLRTQFLEDTATQKNMIGDLDEMEKMIGETLAFARDDSTKEEMIGIDLVSLLRTLCDEMQDMGHKVSFRSRLHRASVQGRVISLKRAFTNLINNGIRYAQEVEVLIFRYNKKLIVSIRDRGPGIPTADLERVFAPFYRGEASRSRDTGGVGLGLAVTRDILHAHHAGIVLKNRKGHGLSVRVEFPSLGSLSQ